MIPPPRASNVPSGAFESAFSGGSEGSAAGDAYEDALPALSPAPASMPLGGDEEGPPLEELETQMRGEVAARDENPANAPSARRRATAASVEEDDGDGKNAPLPEVDALVARLPAEVRETLDELFRARFVAVKKLPKKLLQPASAKKGGNS